MINVIILILLFSFNLKKNRNIVKEYMARKQENEVYN